MTILTAAQSAMARLVGRRPAAVVSSTNEMEVEITSVAYEAAVDIAKSHDWQELTTLHTVTGTGDESYPMPADYDRMVQGMGVSSPSWPDWWYSQARSLDEWETIKVRDFSLEPGWWMLLGGRFHVLPALSVGNTARFYYISNDLFLAENGTPKSTITQDSDSFRLNERLLTLAIIWRWKQMKGFDYAEDMRSYEIALDQEQARDKGSRIRRENGSSRFHGAVPAWPWSLG